MVGWEIELESPQNSDSESGRLFDFVFDILSTYPTATLLLGLLSRNVNFNFGEQLHEAKLTGTLYTHQKIRKFSNQKFSISVTYIQAFQLF